MLAEATTHIHQPIERVWEAWTRPDELQRWYPDRVEGSFAQGREVCFAWDCYGMELDLRVDELDPPHFLALTGNPSGRREQRQEVQLDRVAEGTVVTVKHANFGEGERAEDERAGTEAGWNTMLEVLRIYLERYQNEDRRTFAVLGNVDASPEQTFERFSGESGLASWLGRTQEIHVSGAPICIDLADDSTITGELISVTPPYELAFIWDAIDGVVALRSFTLAGEPRARLAGAWVSSWSRDPEAIELAHSVIAGSVETLIRDLGGTLRE